LTPPTYLLHHLCLYTSLLSDSLPQLLVQQTPFTFTFYNMITELENIFIYSLYIFSSNLYDTCLERDLVNKLVENHENSGSSVETKTLVSLPICVSLGVTGIPFN